jgi:hypothetical protein
MPALGGLALSLILLPSTASAAGPATVMPVTSFTVTSSQCDGPTYGPVLTPALDEVYAELESLVGTQPGQGAYPPVFSSCTPLPAAGSPLYGSASVSSVAAPNGSASVSVQALGNELVEQSADVDTTLTASMTLSSPATSVTYSVPYTTSGLSQTDSNDDAFALVSFSQAIGLMHCTDGSYGTWSTPPGQYDLESPSGPASGTASVTLFCPDGSQLAPGAVGLGVNLLADAYSDNNSQTAAGANIALNGVTATINP